MIFTFFLDVLVVDKTKTVCEKPEYNVQVHSIHKKVWPTTGLVNYGEVTRLIML